MAEHDYVRLAAACHCGEPVKLWSGRGRKPKFCESHKVPPKQKAPATQQECPGCRGFFTPNAKGGPKQKYCSRQCAYRTRRGNKPRQMWSLHCIFCGAGFESLDEKAIYCSKSCGSSAWKKANPERYKAMPSTQRQVSRVHAGYCATCSQAFVSRLPRRYCGDACAPSSRSPYVLGEHYTPPVRTCVHCNLKWSAITRMGPAMFCPSPDCQAERARLLRKLRSGRDYASESRRQGLEYENFDPNEVLARDGWTCQLCGIATPSELRGTYDPCAPELDHKVPRSRQGPHTRENTQCLCRSCNSWKRDRTMEEAMTALVS